MKQKDIALIIIIAAIAGAISFFASRAVFASAGNRSQTAEVVDAITTEFVKPSQKYFNNTSINPTQLIQIGTGTNTNPFASGQ
jgi:uncharacterized membrane protein